MFLGEVDAARVSCQTMTIKGRNPPFALSPVVGSALHFSPLCLCVFLLLHISSSVFFSLLGGCSTARSQRNEPGSHRFGSGRKSCKQKAAVCDYDECAAPRCVIYLSGLSQTAL